MNKEKEYRIANIIGWGMLVQGCIFFLNGAIWAMTEDTTDRWFLRAAMGVVSFGFAGIILKK